MKFRTRTREFVLVFGDFVLFYAALWLSLALRHGQAPSSAKMLSHVMEFTGYGFIRLVTFYALGLYDLRQLRDLVVMIRNLLAAAALNWIIGTTYFYFLTPYKGLTPKTNLLLVVVLGHLMALAWRRLWAGSERWAPLRQKVAFLGPISRIDELQAELERSPAFGYVPADWNWPGVDLVAADSQWVEDNWELAKPVFSAAVRHGVPVVSLEAFYESLFGKVSPEQAGHPSWMLEHVLPRSDGAYWMIKRAADVCLSVALLVVFSPAFALVWLAIRLTDGAPVLYGQKRLGLLGREFTVWKFRTMVLHAEAAGPFSSGRERDPRITRLGAVLRRFRLDELPQLWNVLTGEMSLVGPRPEWVKEVDVLEKVVPHYHLRHLVRPGVTGWAQVHFRATNNAGDSLEKLRYDLYYVKHLSPALDLGILLKTVKRVLIKDQAMPSPRSAEPAALQSTGRVASALGSILGRN